MTAGASEPNLTVGPKSLPDQLNRIRNSPNLQSQQQTNNILKVVEETIRDQGAQFTPTAYFAALLCLLEKCSKSSQNARNQETAAAVVYLLDLIAPHVPSPLLCSKFALVASILAPTLESGTEDAPFIRSSIGCFVSLLIVQDVQAWAIPPNQTGPRQITAALLALGTDPRPKVRKRAQEALFTVLRNRPLSPSLDHPAADMCAEAALREFESQVKQSSHPRGVQIDQFSKSQNTLLIHCMQLVKTIAGATGGWPSRSLEILCEMLFATAKSDNQHLAMTTFEAFESVFRGIAKDSTFAKLPRIQEAIFDLQPSRHDSRMVPSWIAVVSRGYDVSAQLDLSSTFQSLPKAFDTIVSFLESHSRNIRISASECLISFLVNCIPEAAILEPSVNDQETIEKLAKIGTSMLDVKFQAAWPEILDVLGTMFDAFKWQSNPLFLEVVTLLGDLRESDILKDKSQADKALSKAIRSVGPEAVLRMLPLNLDAPASGRKGRAWLLPLIRDSVCCTKLSHFKRELLPLSEKLFQKVLDTRGKEKTLDEKISETLISQIWQSLAGYFDRPLDVFKEFDQSFAELLSKLLYQQPEMRLSLCRALQTLARSLKAVANQDVEVSVDNGPLTRSMAAAALNHLTTLTPNILSVLFNVYCETAPDHRAPILSCIDVYMSIIKAEDVSSTFERVSNMLDSAISDQNAKEDAKDRGERQKDANESVAHPLMDLIVTATSFLPRDCYERLFQIAAVLVSQTKDARLQKKAYKLIPRLKESVAGTIALQERHTELRELMLHNADSVNISSRKDRLAAISVIIDSAPKQHLSFIPSILPEVILRTKESNERARSTAFAMILQMGRKMSEGGVIDSSKANQDTMDTELGPASIEEYFTMISAGLAGTTPNMISASVTALSYALYHFHADVTEAAINDLLDTMSLFLQSPTREVVRSVLGFIKVSIICVPKGLIERRLDTLIPGLLKWSGEHKARFRSKVKNIMERLIRHHGMETVEKYCPPEYSKLIRNIRKVYNRRKHRKAGTADDGGEHEKPQERRLAKYEDAFEQEIYGNDEDSESASSDEEGGAPQHRKFQPTKGKENRRKGETYIRDDDDEPLDLLNRRAFANISSSRPTNKAQAPRPIKNTFKSNEDGKLILGEDSDVEMNDQAGAAPTKDVEEDMSVEQGIDAYVDAIRGRDAARRGQRGKLKFSNRRIKGKEDGDEMEDREAPHNAGKVVQAGKVAKAKASRGPTNRGRARDRVRGGRITKNVRGGKRRF